jgi:hypothetical protein
MLSAPVRKFLLKLQHVSSGLGYHQEEILEHTEAITVQMLKHNSISNITLSLRYSINLGIRSAK